MTKLDEIRARLEEATPGPWEWYNGCSWWRLGLADDQAQDTKVMSPHVCSDGQPTIVVSSSDRALTENAPADIAYLLDQVDNLAAIVKTAAKDLHFIQRYAKELEKSIRPQFGFDIHTRQTTSISSADIIAAARERAEDGDGKVG